MKFARLGIYATHNVIQNDTPTTHIRHTERKNSLSSDFLIKFCPSQQYTLKSAWKILYYEK